MEPKISVIIPAFNYSEFISACLNSIQGQTFKNFECIVVNDGSYDNTEEVVLRWLKDERFKYVYQSNAGVSRARNKGINLSVGQYILPVDADDIISPNYLEECYAAIETDPDIKVVYGDSYLLKNPKKKWNLDPFSFEDLLYKNMIHCSGLYRRDDWKKIGGYDEKMTNGLEDWEFWIRLLKDGGKALKIRSAQFYYRIKDNSLNKSVIENHYGYNSRLYIFNKHLEIYRKTNFYDMYFENHKLKKKVQNPLTFLKFSDLILLLFEVVWLKLKWICRRFSKAL